MGEDFETEIGMTRTQFLIAYFVRCAHVADSFARLASSPTVQTKKITYSRRYMT